MELDLEAMCMARHPGPEWVSFRELRLGTGYNQDSTQRIDVAAFNAYPSKKFFRVAYEVKRSRSDFKKELSQPDKRVQAETYFDETWFVFSDPKIAKPEEIPEGWGLMVLHSNGLKRIRLASQRQPEPLPETLWLSILRSIIKSKGSDIEFDGTVLSKSEMSALIHREAHKEVEPWLARIDEEKLKLRSLQKEAQQSYGALVALVQRGASYNIKPEDFDTDGEFVEKLLSKAVGRMLANHIRYLDNAKRSINELTEMLRK